MQYLGLFGIPRIRCFALAYSPGSSRMSRKSLLLLAGLWVALATSDVPYTPSPSTVTPAATTIATIEPSGKSITAPPDVTAEVIILANPSDITSTPHEVSPTVVSPGSTHVSISPTSSSSHAFEGSTNTRVPQNGPRVLSKRSEARGLLVCDRAKLGVCSPPTATRYFTVTSTQIVPTVTYATATQYIPTVISEVRQSDWVWLRTCVLWYVCLCLVLTYYFTLKLGDLSPLLFFIFVS